MERDIICKKLGVYPGSFKPWHLGHTDIVLKSLGIFDQVIIAQGNNQDKPKTTTLSWDFPEELEKYKHRIKHEFFDGPLKHFIEEKRFNAVIRGLRNGNDLQYEMNNQYWNEDVGVKIPFVYFITDRRLAHVSSSAIRGLESLGLEHKY